MSKVTVYQFTVYDVTHDEHIRSRRWGTLEGIKGVCGVAVKDTATEIDDRYVDKVDGLTERGFDPNPREGFQTQVDVGPRAV